MKTLIILVVLIIGWDLGWYFAGVKPLFPWQLKKLLKEKTDRLTLIDVRTPGGFNLFHINGAANMPDLLSNADGFTGKRVDEPEIIICMTGRPWSPTSLKNAATNKSTISPGECWPGNCLE